MKKEKEEEKPLKQSNYVYWVKTGPKLDSHGNVRAPAN
jgi:hypothetical protein